MRNRLTRVRLLNTLDPREDCQEIQRIYTKKEFPWDYGRGLEVALWKACCVPEISAILQQGGHFELFSQKRYDDTRILLGEIVAHGYNSTRGRQAIKQINRAHRRFDLDNEDMLYVLSTFIYEPIFWIDRWAWRKSIQVEKLASFHFFCAIGKLMNVTDIPTDYDEFLRFKQDYERRRFRYAESNERVGKAILSLYSSWHPWPINRLFSATLRCRLDGPARQALGFADPTALARAASFVGLRAHGLAELAAPRLMAKLMTRPSARTYPGYPHGYDLSHIGAHELATDNGATTASQTGAGYVDAALTAQLPGPRRPERSTARTPRETVPPETPRTSQPPRPTGSRQSQLLSEDRK
nr:DUF2236 domain-containing protein [Saccharopolyspora pogona]